MEECCGYCLEVCEDCKYKVFDNLVGKKVIEVHISRGGAIHGS